MKPVPHNRRITVDHWLMHWFAVRKLRKINLDAKNRRVTKILPVCEGLKYQIFAKRQIYLNI